jgi:magnesium chelatase family protein
VGVRVWGVVEDRLVELETGPCHRFEIRGLPPRNVRTTADRVRAALINSGLAAEAPGVLVDLHPSIRGGPASELDVAIAIATLVGAGRLDTDRLGWILALGRLGLDGRIHGQGPARLTLADAVGSLSDP